MLIETYKKLDTNQDGYLDVDELVSGMQEVRVDLFDKLDR